MLNANNKPFSNTRYRGIKAEPLTGAEVLSDLRSPLCGRFRGSLYWLDIPVNAAASSSLCWFTGRLLLSRPECVLVLSAEATVRRGWLGEHRAEGRGRGSVAHREGVLAGLSLCGMCQTKDRDRETERKDQDTSCVSLSHVNAVICISQPTAGPEPWFLLQALK